MTAKRYLLLAGLALGVGASDEPPPRPHPSPAIKIASAAAFNLIDRMLPPFTFLAWP